MGNLSNLQTASRASSPLFGTPLGADARLVDHDLALQADETALFGSGSGCSFGDILLSGLTVPATPVVTAVGTGGAAHFSYSIADVSNVGLAVSATNAFTTANATLSTTNYNQVVCPGLLAGHTYNLYRTLSNGTPSTVGLLASFTVAAVAPGVDSAVPTGAYTYTYNDVGLAATAAEVPIVNSTGSAQIAGPLFTSTVFSGGVSGALGGKVVLDGGAASLTPAQVLADVLVRTGSAGAVNDTTPTAAALVAAAGPGIRAGAIHKWVFRNENNGVNTIVAGSSVTLRSGNTNTITNAHSRTFWVVFTTLTVGAEAVEIISGPESAF